MNTIITSLFCCHIKEYVLKDTLQQMLKNEPCDLPPLKSPEPCQEHVMMDFSTAILLNGEKSHEHHQQVERVVIGWF